MDHLRERLEIDVDGKSLADKREEFSRQSQSYQTKTNRLSRFHSLKSRLPLNGVKSWVLALLLLLVIILGVGEIVSNLFSGNLTGWQREAFSTIEEKHGEVVNSILGVQESLTDAYLTQEERERKAFYGVNKIRDPKLLDKQPYQEYVVYVFSSDESLNEPFNQYLSKWESSLPTPVYRLEASHLSSHVLADILGDNQPGFVIYRDNTGEVVRDSVIDNPNLLSELKSYLDKIIREDDEYLKSKVGEYHKARWLQGEQVDVVREAE